MPFDSEDAQQDATYVTSQSEPGLSEERTLAVGTGLGLTDNGAGNDVTVDADTLRGEDYVTTSSASSLSNETVASDLSAVYGSPVDLGGAALEDSGRGYVEVASGDDLRLATGQSIEDGSGQDRFDMLGVRTGVFDSDGKVAILLAGGTGNVYRSYPDTPYRIRDQEGSFSAVEYATSASPPGTFELIGAVLDFGAGQSSTTNDSMTANPESDTEDGFIEVDIGGTRFQIPAYSP